MLSLQLRQQLQSDQFQLLGCFPVLSNEADWKSENPLLYESTQWTRPTERKFRIRILTLLHNIVVLLGQFVP
jgi:hypothetical protein